MKTNALIAVLKVLTLLCFITASVNLSSQHIKTDRLVLSHPVNYFPVKKPISNYSNLRYSFGIPDTLNVYAVMVQFHQTNNPNVTGNGRFDLSNSFPDSVDCPPHDSAYFAHHLEFLKNYYIKSSKGMLVVNFHLLGSVRTLSGTLDEYAPARLEGLQKMGRLFKETWGSVDSVNGFFNNVNPDKSAFVIFHAGTGRDVDLISSGIFQGGLDIPSLFLSNRSLKEIYGDTTKGFYTKEGFIIPSSCILPEQEYRIINSSFGNQFLELGMNGIVCATIGSNLGLPDLFDTQSGRTAIGRFGLMDGQSLFSYLGVFPPEPSAWEKQYMGWVNPIVVTSDGNYTTSAASVDYGGNRSVYKVLISEKEYFLVENRNRDALKNGQTVYYVRNGTRDSAKFQQDVDGFSNDGIWRLRGSITDVDELDWSLPGLKNDTANYQGGILVWHIDENVIDANFESNTINTNIHHRGVNLEEAKGSQDIGVVISTPLGDFVSDGFFVDFWYNGDHYRPSNIYQNRFDATTFPNSNSYTGIHSRVCLSNFTTIDSAMTFTFQVCSSVTNIPGYPHKVGKDLSGNAQPVGIDYNGNGQDEVFVNVNDTLYGFRDNGSPIRVDRPNGFLKDSLGMFMPGYVEYNIGGNSRFISGVHGNKIGLLSFTIDSSTSAPQETDLYYSGGSITTPVLSDPKASLSVLQLFTGTSDGKVVTYRLDSLNYRTSSFSSYPVIELASSLTGPLPLVPSAIDTTKKFFAQSYIWPIGQPHGIEGQSTPVYVDRSNKILANNVAGSGSHVISDNLGISNVYTSPVIADLNKDGLEDIIFTADNRVYAINQNGIPLDHFPFSVAGVDRISSGVSVADLDGDGVNDIVFGTSDGRIYAYNANGQILDGFPLLAGSEIKSTPAIINSGGKFGLAVYSTDGFLYGFKTAWSYDSNKVLWRNYLADKYHSNISKGSQGSTVTGPCLPKERFYNWPNPAYGTSTNIRYYLGNDAGSVTIKILDLAGELVTTLKGTNYKGFDNEVIWYVNNVQSGIYIAVIQLEGGSCSESASIKIAVVK